MYDNKAACREWRTNNLAKAKADNLRNRQKHNKYWLSHDPYTDMSEKVCGKCKKPLPRIAFYRDSSRADGLNGHCKDCAYLKNVRSAKSRMLSHARARARKMGLEFSLKLEDIQIPSHCPVFGIPLFRGKGSNPQQNPNSPSLDRRNNLRGYVSDNIRVISNRANVLKSDATLEELEAICLYMRSDL